jgi:hypothetical protein
MIELKKALVSKRRKKPREAYLIVTSKDPVAYWRINGDPTINIALAKVFFRRDKIEAFLEEVRQNYPEAEIQEVSVTTDDEGAEIVNGYPHRDTIRKSKLRYAVWDKYGGRCAYCGRLIPLKSLHIDRFYPARDDEDDNLMPACGECAKLKEGLTPGQFQALIEHECRTALRKNIEYRIALLYGLVAELPRVTFYYAKPEAQIQLELSAERAREREESKMFVYSKAKYKEETSSKEQTTGNENAEEGDEEQ